jgi:hypothetical protein
MQNVGKINGLRGVCGYECKMGPAVLCRRGTDWRFCCKSAILSGPFGFFLNLAGAGANLAGRFGQSMIPG